MAFPDPSQTQTSASRPGKSVPSFSSNLFLLSACIAIFGIFAWTTGTYLFQQELSSLTIRTGLAISQSQRQAEFRSRELMLVAEQTARFVTRTPPVAGIGRALTSGGIDPLDGDSLAKWITRLEQICFALTESNPAVFQIRLIGLAEGGRELVRTHRTPSGTVTVVAPEDLQPKDDSLYFTQALRLPGDSCYYSPIELNREFGKPEQPPRPTVRASIAVRNAQGEVFGVVVVNMLAQPLLENLAESEIPDVQCWMTNSAGHYLWHPQTGRAFAHELGQPAATWQTDFTVASTAQALLPLTGLPRQTVRATGGMPDGMDWLMFSRQLRAPDSTGAGGLVLHTGIPVTVLRHNAWESTRGRLLAVWAEGVLTIGLVVWMLIRWRGSLPYLTSGTQNDASQSPASDFATRWLRISPRWFQLVRGLICGLLPVVWWVGVSVFSKGDMRFPFILMLPPVMLASWWGGMYSGVLATFIAMVGVLDLSTTATGMFDLTNRGQPIDLLSHGFFCIAGLLLTFTQESVRRQSAEVFAQQRKHLNERHAAELAAANEARKAHQILQTASDGIYVLDTAGNVLLANTAFAESLGCTPEEVHTLNVRDWEAKWPADKIPQSLEALFANPESQVFETVHRRRDGVEFDVEVHVRPVTIDGRSMLYASSRDISRRKAIEAALRESNETLRRQESENRKLAAVVANTDNAVVLTDVKGCIEWVNEGFTRISGYSLAEVQGCKPGELLQGPESDPHAANRMSDAIRAGEAFSEEIINYDKNGRKYWIAINAQPVFDENGRVTGFMAIESDITERKAIELAIRAEAQKNQLLLQTASDGIHILDLKGNVLQANDAFARMLGYTVEEVLRLNVRDFEATLNEEAIQQQLARFATDTPPITLERTARRSDGSLIDAEMCIQGVSIFGERVIYAAARDITERKLLQARLLTERDYLDDMVRQRTQELEQARDAAESATRAKSDFLANMSHEVRSPMSVIIGYADLLLDSRSTPADRENAAAAIRRSGQHLLQVINDVLDLSRIESGKLLVEFEDCDPWGMLEDVVAAYRNQAEEKQIAVLLEADGPVPVLIRADPTRLRQILMNLLSNALKFTESQKTIRIELSVHQTPGSVCFCVADQGIGMTPEQLSRLFRPFEQADNSVTRRYGGTGLGLSICKLLAEAMEGSIEVHSELAAGSTFRLLLPIAENTPLCIATMHQRYPQMVTDTPTASPPVPTGSGRILLAEDSLDLQRLLAWRLRIAGFEVTTADNGRMAVELATQQTFDAVLTDVQMPEMDGQAATRQLRALGFTKPIIGLSAHAMKGEREKNLEAGMNEYLTKPVDIDLLVSVLQEFIDTQQTTSTESSHLPPTTSNSQPQPNPQPRDIFAELRKEFLRGIPARLASMQKFLDEGQLGDLARLAHQLRGTAGSYQVPILSETAGLVEDACKEGQPIELIRDLISDLHQEASNPSLS